jgi:hypothetical protein
LAGPHHGLIDDDDYNHGLTEDDDGDDQDYGFTKVDDGDDHDHGFTDGDDGDDHDHDDHGFTEDDDGLADNGGMRHVGTSNTRFLVTVELDLDLDLGSRRPLEISSKSPCPPSESPPTLLLRSGVGSALVLNQGVLFSFINFRSIVNRRLLRSC